ncbi:MAG: MFS transporter [Dehalococcoidales bacterium]|nr:MAG: MFS transporter [Dehalococcoidales bacterium]
MRDNVARMYGIGVFTFILFLSTLIGTPVLPKLSQELGASDTLIPVILSASLITVVIAQFFTGILADRWSKRALILIGALLGSVSSLLTLIAADWVPLLLLRILAGIADAIAMPALLVITSQLGTEQPGKFFGILRGSQGLSFVVGPALGSLFSLASLRTPFLADGILSLVAFFAAFKLIKDDDRPQVTHDLSVFTGIKRLLQHRMVYVYLLLGISGMFAYGILANFIPTKAQILGLAPWQIGLIISTGALVHSVTSFTVGSLSDRYGRKLFAIIAQPIIIISAVILIFCNGFFPILITYWVFVVGETITFLLSFVYASEAFDKRYIGTSMAIFDSMIDLSLAVGPFLGILAFGISNQINYPFLIAVIPSVICLPFLFSLPSRTGKPV